MNLNAKEFATGRNFQNRLIVLDVHISVRRNNPDHSVKVDYIFGFFQISVSRCFRFAFRYSCLRCAVCILRLVSFLIRCAGFFGCHFRFFVRFDDFLRRTGLLGSFLCLGGFDHNLRIHFGFLASMTFFFI